VVSGGDQTFTLDAAGMGSVRVTSNAYGTCRVGVDVTALDGVERSQAGEEDVTQAQGSCSAPSCSREQGKKGPGAGVSRCDVLIDSMGPVQYSRRWRAVI
jgi:hypothetical protein